MNISKVRITPLSVTTVFFCLASSELFAQAPSNPIHLPSSGRGLQTDQQRLHATTRARKVIPLLIVAGAAAIGGKQFWGYLDSYESTDDAQIERHLNAMRIRPKDQAGLDLLHTGMSVEPKVRVR
jgi:hypothetical protein